MELLESEWLINMLDKSSKDPKQRLTNLFSTVDDWLEAPHVQKDWPQENAISSTKLQDYLCQQARQSGAKMPEMLGHQLYFMVLAAAQDKIRHQNTQSLIHAQLAAKAIIHAQTAREWSLTKRQLLVVATCSLIIMAASGWFMAQQFSPKSEDPLVMLQTRQDGLLAPSRQVLQLTASPSQTAALFSRIEQMRKGNCQLIEAIQLPDAYKEIYFENIVMGQISSKLEDQKIVTQLLDMVRCNYTPMLMANSK